MLLEKCYFPLHSLAVLISFTIFAAKRRFSQGEYANFAIITHSSSDFIIDFARVLPGVPKAQVKSRVILAPEHAKRLLAAIQENIMRYEKEFGPIRIPNQQAAPIAPFDLTKGEA